MALDIITDLNVLGDIDLNKKELQNAVIQVLSTKPGSPATGQIFYDSDVNQVQVYTGSAWEGLVTETVDTTAMTATTSILNTSLVVGRDSTDQIKFSTNNQIIFRVDGGDGVTFKGSGEIEATSLDISGDVDVDGTLETDALSINGTAVSSTAAELNILDGVTSTAAELNILDGVTSTAAELNVLDGITAVVGELNALDIGSTAVGTAVASKAVILDSNKDYTGFRNITLSGELDAGSLDVSGDADIDGTLEADAITIGTNNILTGGIITTLGTIAQDDIIFTSAQANDPMLTLENTANDTNGARVLLLKDKGAAGADNDEVGEIIFAGDNDAQQQTNFAKIRGLISDASDGSEGGKFEVRVATHDGEMQPGLVIQDGDAEDEIDVTIGNGANSVVTIPGSLVVTGTTTTNNVETVTTSSGVIFEGTNADGHDATLKSVVAGADITYTLPNVGGHVALFAADPSTTTISSTPAELNILDGVTASTAELNIMDGVTATTAELNIMDGVTSTAAELNILDGVTSTADELNILDGVTSTAAELNILDGVTSTAAELNILDGVTSTATELNLLDAGTAGGSVTLATGDSVIIGDASASNASKKALLSDVITLIGTNITETGALNSGSITSGFGAIDNGSSGIKTNTFTATTSVIPDASDGATLGSASKEWSDLYLADGAQILFGDDQEVRITHNADSGLTLSHEATGAATPFVLTIESEEDVITANDVIGGVQFKAGDSDGSDAILPAAGIFAIAADTFGGTSNRSKLVFSVAATETAGLASGAFDATADMTLSHAGLLTITDDLVIKASGTIGGADDTDLLTLGNAILTVAGEVSMTTLDIGGTNVTSTAAELNILDGVTSTAAELNILDGVTSTAAELNILDGVTSTAAELNILDGVTSTAAELNILDGVTSTAAELNILDGVTSTTAEINLIDGGTSRTTNAVADGDGILHNNGGTMEMTKVETFATYFAAECAGLREKVFVLNNSTSGVASSDNITYTVTHSLNTRNVMVEVIRNGSNSGDFSTVLAEVKRNGDDTIQVVFATARTAGDYTVMIRAIG